jgi:hypothetical protein
VNNKTVNGGMLEFDMASANLVAGAMAGECLAHAALSRKSSLISASASSRACSMRPARPPRSNQTEKSPLLQGSIGQHLIEELVDGTLRFGNRGGMIWRACEVRVCEGNSSERGGAANLPRRRISIIVKKEARLWAHVRMTPAVGRRGTPR